MADDRRGTTRPGLSYKDPQYAAIEAPLEQKYGLPAGGMAAIRTRGERSSADQVSPVGAHTVYQIMPHTRDLFLRKYGIDANAGAQQAAEVAALHLRDDMRRTGSWQGAVANYIGGPDRSKHGPVTAAYTARVTGSGGGDPGSPPLPQSGPQEPVRDFSGDWLNMRPSDPSARPLPAHAAPIHVNTHTSEVDRQARLTATVGKDNLFNGYVSDSTPADQDEVAHREATAAAAAKQQAGLTPWDKVAASWRDNTLTSSIYHSLSSEHPEEEDGYSKHYLANIDNIEAGARTDAELQQLRNTTSRAGLAVAQEDIKRKRDLKDTYAGEGTSGMASLMYGLLGGVADPVGLAAGGGIGKAFQTVGIGSRVLYQAGRTGAALASAAGEGALANVAIKEGQSLAGDYVSTEEFAQAAAFGAIMNVGMSPLLFRGSKPDTSVVDIFDRGAAASRAETQGMVNEATATLGGDAHPDAIAAEVSRISNERATTTLRNSLADIPDELQLMSDKENLLTTHEPTKVDVQQRHNLDGISDDAERAVVTEIVARAERIDKDNPVNPEALNPSTGWIGQQSTGIDLLKSDSVAARAFGQIATEGTTGAGGRRRTAALSQAVRERFYDEPMNSYADLYHMFRKSEGRSLLAEAWDGSAWRQFEKRIYMELEARGGTKKGVTFDEHPAVVRAADAMERGYTIMREEQQHVDTVGSARLGTGPDASRGYVPHKMLGTKVLALSAEQQRGLRKVLSKQLQQNEYTENVDGVATQRKFDKPFSDKLATKYIEQAKRRAQGGFDVPMNLHTSEAADIVRDSLEAMHLPPDQIESLMGKFSRGGAQHTQQRLRLDLDADIGDGAKLVDLFDTSVSNLYRGYARRVSGEVALAQYGIMGKKGLMVMRTALESTGADTKTLRAYDQVAAELLNTPFGGWNHKYMDNLRIATSISRLGGMGFTQFAEYGNGMAALGVHRVMSAIGGIPRLLKEVTQLRKGGEAKNPILHSIDTLGGHLGMDDYAMTRLFDVRDNAIQVYGTEQIGLGTRLLRAGGNLQTMLSGHRMILAVQVRGMAEQIARKAMQYARAGTDDIALDDMGITADLRAALRRNLDNLEFASFTGNKLDTLDLTKGDLTGHEMLSIRAAIERGSSQIIQRTYTGETGKWAHNGLLKMLFQFRTFSLISVEKQWGRNVANHGALKSFMYLMGAASFAIPIHLARVQAKTIGMSRTQREKYVEQNLSVASLGRATLNYASAAGLSGDIMDVGVGFASAFGGKDLGTSLGGRQGAGPSNLIGGVVAPGVGLLEDINKGLHGDGQRLARAVPGSNLPYVQPLLNAATPEKH